MLSALMIPSGKDGEGTGPAETQRVPVRSHATEIGSITPPQIMMTAARIWA